MRFGGRFLVFTTVAAALAGPLAASGISYVTTFSSIFAGGVDNNYDSVTGLSQNAGSCYLSGGGTGPCATLSSSPSTDQLGLTASSVTIANGVGYDPDNGISEYGDASAAANLATGVIAAYVNGPNCSTPNASGCDSGGTAIAEMQDSLTFTNNTGGAVDIGINWSFDGSVTTLGTYPSTTVMSLFCFAPGAQCSGNQNAVPHGPLDSGQSAIFEYQDGSVTENTVPTGPEWVSAQLTAGANSTSETFEGVFAIPDGVSTDSLNAYLEVSCLISTCDFSHTGAFSIDPLPGGVSFTSSSGVLLSDATPEPAAWAICFCGLGLLALRRR